MLSRYLNQRSGNIGQGPKEPLCIRTRSNGSWVKITIEDSTVAAPTTPKLLSTHGPVVHHGLADVTEAIEDALEAWKRPTPRHSRIHPKIHSTPDNEFPSGLGLVEDDDTVLDAWRPFKSPSTSNSESRSRSNSELSTSSTESEVLGGSPFRWSSPESPMPDPLRIFTDKSRSITKAGGTRALRDLQETPSKAIKPWQIDSDNQSLASGMLWKDGIHGDSWGSEDREARSEKKSNGGGRKTKKLRHMGGSLPQRKGREKGSRQGHTSA